ncbi:hypothetical protein ABZ802_26235 [Streptomyces sp. NPDC047737]|uniref:hypothetical protein n=1 Tax=unclassified Streptomyces TaxID=2593676 RepID=UPI00340B16F2
MRIGRPLVTGWAALAVAGWAATLWLGEPSATTGPGPAPAVRAPVGNPEPGPQPEGSCGTPTPTPTPSESTVASLEKVPEEYAQGYAKQTVCTSTVIRDYAVIR